MCNKNRQCKKHYKNQKNYANLLDTNMKEQFLYPNKNNKKSNNRRKMSKNRKKNNNSKNNKNNNQKPFIKQ